MPIELAGISLNRIHKIATAEQADFVKHRIPGLNGNVVQNMGRNSVVVQIEGIFSGTNAKDDLEKLRDVYKKREPTDFLADITGQAYFSQVIIQRLEVWQRASEQDQYSYLLEVSEYVPPPEPESDFGFPDVEAAIGLEALDFMDMIELPNLLSVPELANPAEPLITVMDNLGNVMNGMSGPANELSGWFGSANPANRAAAARHRALRAAGGNSIFDRIGLNVDASNILAGVSLIVGKLTGANTELSNLFENQPSGIEDTGSFLQGLPSPGNDTSSTLSQGFANIARLLPTETSGITGALSGALDEFFNGLNINLTGNFGKVIAGFEAIITLTQLDYSLDEDEDAADGTPRVVKTTRSAALRSLRAPGDPNPAIEAIEEMKARLAIIPENFPVEVMLGWMLEALKQIPRERYPLRYLPLIDELRDKLETTLAWKAMDGAALSSHIASSVNKLRMAMLRNLYDEGANPIAQRIGDIAQFVEEDTLGEALDGLKNSLSALKQMVQNGDLSAAQPDLDKLANFRQDLEFQLLGIQEQLFQGQLDALNDDLANFKDEMEARMLQLIADLNPPSDLPLLSILITPANRLLDEVGFSSLVTQIREVLGDFKSLLDQLNLAEFQGSISGVVDDATSAIDGLKETLIGATVELTSVMNDVENAITSLGVAQIIDAMKQALDDFRKFVEDGVNTVFEPVRVVLIGTLDTIEGLLNEFSPAQLVEELKNLLQILTSVLSDPQLLNAIDTLRSGLDTANDELGSFSFKPVTDVVVQAIEAVGSALEIALALPLPDSLRQELEDALGILPPSLHPLSDAVNSKLQELVEDGPVPVLEAVRDAPGQLVEIVESYSPSNFIGENLTKPYQDFLIQMEGYRPGQLLEPVKQALSEAKTEVQETLDPEKLMQPLQAGFDELLGLLAQIDPNTIIAPLQAQLSAGIRAITDNLPLDPVNEVFDKIGEVADQFSKGLEVGTALEALLLDIQTRLAGLAGAEDQVRQFGDGIAAKLNDLSDITLFQQELENLATALDSFQAEPLVQVVVAPLDATVAKLEALKPKQKLSALGAAHRGFPRPALEALPNTAEKLALLAFLDDFDPLSEAVAIPLNALDHWQTDLQGYKSAWQTAFSDWDARFHGTNSPLNELRLSNADIAAVKALLEETIQQELTEALAPLFKIFDHFSSFFAALLQEFTALITDLQQKLAGFLQITNALEALRNAVNGLVQTIENFDLTFIADEIKDVFDAVKIQLEAISPARIASLVKKAFDDLLAILDLDALLGTQQLDERYNGILDSLKANDPTKLLAEVVQPEYDKIPAFLQRLDMTEPINLFIERIEALRIELEAELNRTADAYDGMVEVVPADLQGSMTGSVSI